MFFLVFLWYFFRMLCLIYKFYKPCRWSTGGDLPFIKKPYEDRIPSNDCYCVLGCQFSKVYTIHIFGLVYTRHTSSGSCFITFCFARCLDWRKSALHDFREIVFCVYLYFADLNWFETHLGCDYLAKIRLRTQRSVVSLWCQNYCVERSLRWEH